MHHLCSEHLTAVQNHLGLSNPTVCERLLMSHSILSKANLR